MTDAKVLKAKGGRQVSRCVWAAVIYLLLFLYLIWVLAPFLVIVLTSLTSDTEVMATMEFTWFPEEICFDAFREVFVDDYLKSTALPSVVLGFLNTLWMVVPFTVAGLFVSGLAAFAYSKMRFRLKKPLYAILLSSMMLPTTVMTIPSYIMYDTIGWSGTPLPLIIPGLFGNVATIFFLRQFFSGIPNDIVDAAKIDGLGYFSIYARIVLPLAKPAFLAQGVFLIVSGYNNYLGPLLYLTEPNLATIQLIVSQFSSSYLNDYPVQCAVALVALVPLIVVYAFLQKFFIEGIAATGLKE